MEQLNQYFQIWLDSFYHERRHGETKQSPKHRFEENENPLLFPTLDDIKQAFMWEEKRKVDRTGCVSFQQNKYEVEQELVGQEVTLRYNPFDLTCIQIWYEGKEFLNATPLDVHRNIDKRVENEKNEISIANELSGLNFLELSQPEHKKQKKEKLGKLSYSRLLAGGTT